MGWERCVLTRPIPCGWSTILCNRPTDRVSDIVFNAPCTNRSICSLEIDLVLVLVRLGLISLSFSSAHLSLTLPFTPFKRLKAKLSGRLVSEHSRTSRFLTEVWLDTNDTYCYMFGQFIDKVFRSPILAGSHVDRISCAASSIVLKPHVRGVENSSPNIELEHILIPPYRPSESVFLCQQPESNTLGNIPPSPCPNMVSEVDMKKGWLKRPRELRSRFQSRASGKSVSRQLWAPLIR